MLRNKKDRLFLGIVIIAVVIKVSLFLFAAVNAPNGKLLPDSPLYLELSDILASRGVFATQGVAGNLIFENFRTPGYPLFLTVFHNLMRIPLDGIVLLQMAMTLLASFLVYRAALIVEPRIAFLSALIILFDPPITIFSLTILTESLFLLLISMFMYFFVLYLKDKRTGHLIMSALILAMSAYVRPVAYYLGLAVAFFIVYANSRRQVWNGLRHAVIFIVVVYSIIGLWQVRNYVRCHDISFCTADQFNLSSVGLFKSYARNIDPHTKGMAPLPYYMNVSTRCLMSLMTRPGNFKYFQCEPLNLGSFVFSYPWMVFWLSGLIWGIFKMGRNIYLQGMLFIMLYFIAVSVGGLMWSVGERMRVPIMPFIAIISAYGWLNISLFIRQRPG